VVPGGPVRGRASNGPNPLRAPPLGRPTHPLPPRPHSFGLKTVDEAGKLHFNTTEGNHLQFSKEQLAWWVKHQFV
jgi:hypothetical protein